MGNIAVHLAVAGDVFDGVFLRCPFSHEMSWMRFGTSLSQFLSVFPTYFCSLVTLVNTVLEKYGVHDLCKSMIPVLLYRIVVQYILNKSLLLLIYLFIRL